MSVSRVKTVNTIKVKTGSLYELGRHRLLCADSSIRQNIQLLLGKKKIGLVFASPPYFGQKPFSHWNRYEEYLLDMELIISNCWKVMKDGAIIIWCIGDGLKDYRNHISQHSELLERQGFRYLDAIIGIKKNPNYGTMRHFHIKINGNYYPAPQWEVLLIYQKPGKMPVMTPSRRKYMAKHNTDVWQIGAICHQQKKYGHPTVCPEEIVYQCIIAYSSPQARILDPFGGSGTTLMAAERAHQSAFLLELNPKYCENIIKNWEKRVGKG